jgi:hypothetical protein
MKNYSEAIKTAISNEQPIIGLIRMNLNGSTLYLTTGAHDIEYDGETWVSSGLVLSIGELSEKTQLSVQSIDIEFTAVDQSVIALFTNANQQNKSVILKLAVLDNVHQVVGELYSKTYIIDSFSDQNDENEATISVEVSNFFSDFEAVRGIRSTQASFARFYPNTTSFINSKDIKKELKWGGE